MTVAIEPLLDSLILRGHPVTLRVDGGHLIAEDGLVGRRRRAVLSRICPDVQRILIFARSGYVSLEALGWLHDTGIPLIHLHPNGEPIFATARVTGDDARIRRAQAAAETSSHGVSISRWLLSEKIRRQSDIVRKYFQLPDLAGVLDEARTSLDTVETLPRLRLIESAAAAVYWSAWTGLRPRFPLASTRKIPTHWQTMKNRRSPITDSPRRAADPINCMLNYLYSIVAAEVAISLRAHGCDTGLGIIHVDRPNRANMVYDAMEPIRPVVEQFVLQLLRAHTFDRRDFLELKKGDCRVLPPLADHLAAATGDWRADVADTCLGLSRRLEQAGALAQASRPRVHDSRADLKSWKNPPRVLHYLGKRMNAVSAGKTGWYKELPPTPKRCRRCGEFTSHFERTYCDSCAPLRAADGSAKAAQLIRDRKTAGNWMGLSDKSRKTLGRRVSGRFADMRKWSENNPVKPDPGVFSREIFPKLSGISTAELRRATGLTKSYCQRVKRGMYVPHPMHWAAMRTLLAK